MVAARPELAWVLSRGLGPRPFRAGPRCAGPVLEVADRLDLAARIGARVPRHVLDAEVGEEASALLWRRHQQAVAAVMVLEMGCRDLASAARELGVPVIFLKGMALQLRGRQPSGSRSVADIDALVPADAAETVQRELVRRGWVAAGIPPAEHQLPPVASPRGAVVEVHTMVRGVRLTDARSSASALDLIHGGLVEALPQLEGQCSVPTDEVMMAHLLAHGLAQHGFSPHAYPGARLLADVQDLAWDEARWSCFSSSGLRWIERDVGAASVAAVRELAERLAAGEPPLELLAEEGEAGVLLRHVVAGGLDQDYRRSLRFAAVTRPLAASGRAATLVLTLWRSLWLSRAQVDILYGRPGSAVGYLGWRLWRPLDVILRSVRYGRSWLRLRRPRSGAS